MALERYQRSIGRLASCFDERPGALYNRSLVGRVSGKLQPVEMLMWGPVVGQEVAVAVECDQGRQPVGAGAVERFAEKLVDVAADCGIFYAVAGFTTTARARAARMRCPAVMPVSLNRPERDVEPVIPGQRQPAWDAGCLPLHDAEEITEMDFMLYLWLRPGESV